MMAIDYIPMPSAPPHNEGVEGIAILQSANESLHVTVCCEPSELNVSGLEDLNRSLDLRNRKSLGLN